MEIFLRRLRIYAGDHWPYEFAVSSPAARCISLAPVPIRRWRRSAIMQRCGASAFPRSISSMSRSRRHSISRRTSKADATVLVADFGGGTTDYSIIRFETSRRQAQCHADRPFRRRRCGDHFDYRMIDQIVAPQIGKGSLVPEFRQDP